MRIKIYNHIWQWRWISQIDCSKKIPRYKRVLHDSVSMRLKKSQNSGYSGGERKWLNSGGCLESCKAQLLDLSAGYSDTFTLWQLTHLWPTVLPTILREDCAYFPVAIITKYHILGPLQQKFILPLFWRPHVQNQGVNRVSAVLPPEAPEKNLFFHSLTGFYSFYIPWLVICLPVV